MANITGDWRNISSWSFNENATVYAVSDTCPFFPGQVYENTCVDGQRMNYPGENGTTERSDIQRNFGVPYGVERAYEAAIKMITYPTNHASAQSWWLVTAPMEIHGVNLDQAVIQPQCLHSSGIGTQGTNVPRRRSDLPAGEPRFFMDHNAGLGAPNWHLYYDLGPSVLNVWTYFRMVVKLHTSDGYLHVYRDGDTSPRLIKTGMTTANTQYAYPKAPNYSNSGLSGPRVYRCILPVEWDGLMPNRYTDEEPPPPDPPENPDPVTNAQVVDQVTQTVLTWTNPPSGIDQVFIKRSTTSFPIVYTDGTLVFEDSSAPFGTTFTDTDVLEGTTYYYSIFTRNFVSPDYYFSTPVQVSEFIDPPPPDPPPVDPVRIVRTGSPRTENHRGTGVRV